MPQATDELRNEMERLFGDPVDDQGPIAFLQKAGFSLTGQYEWRPPEGVKHWSELTDDQRLCIDFLCDEWDFGGLTYSE